MVKGAGELPYVARILGSGLEACTRVIALWKRNRAETNVCMLGNILMGVNVSGHRSFLVSNWHVLNGNLAL